MAQEEPSTGPAYQVVSAGYVAQLRELRQRNFCVDLAFVQPLSQACFWFQIELTLQPHVTSKLDYSCEASSQAEHVLIQYDVKVPAALDLAKL